MPIQANANINTDIELRRSIVELILASDFNTLLRIATKEEDSTLSQIVTRLEVLEEVKSRMQKVAYPVFLSALDAHIANLPFSGEEKIHLHYVVGVMFGIIENVATIRLNQEHIDLLRNKIQGFEQDKTRLQARIDRLELRRRHLNADIQRTSELMPFYAISFFIVASLYLSGVNWIIGDESGIDAQFFIYAMSGGLAASTVGVCLYQSVRSDVMRARLVVCVAQIMDFVMKQGKIDEKIAAVGGEIERLHLSSAALERRTNISARDLSTSSALNPISADVLGVYTGEGVAQNQRERDENPGSAHVVLSIFNPAHPTDPEPSGHVIAPSRSDSVDPAPPEEDVAPTGGGAACGER